MSSCTCRDCRGGRGAHYWKYLEAWHSRSYALADKERRERQEPMAVFRVVQWGTHWHVQKMYSRKGKAIR